METKLFLDGIFSASSASPNRIVIDMPNPGPSSDAASLHLVGLTTSDPSFSANNKWGTVINDLSNLTDFSSLVGSSNLWSWIGASTMCWKGTAPLSMGIEFFLINYAPGLNLDVQLKKLVKLASLSETKQKSDAQVYAHGGYAANVLTGNSEFFSCTSRFNPGA